MNNHSYGGVTLSTQLTDLHVMPRKPPASEIDRNAGLRLRAVRETFSPDGPINQEFFAAKIGVGRTTLANWEAGKMPDSRAMVRLNLWIGVSLDWIYVGEIGRISFDWAERLRQRAAELGAVVGGPVAEWPMAVRARPGPEGMRSPAAVPKTKRRTVTLHDAQDNFADVKRHES